MQISFFFLKQIKKQQFQNLFILFYAQNAFSGINCTKTAILLLFFLPDPLKLIIIGVILNWFCHTEKRLIKLVHLEIFYIKRLQIICVWYYMCLNKRRKTAKMQ